MRAIAAGLCVLLAALASAAAAQPPGMSAEQVKELQELAKKDPDAARKLAEQYMKAAGQSNGSKPESGNDEQSKDEATKDDEHKKKAEGSGGDSVKRPEKPEKEPDPDELKIEPDANGMVQFSFRGQPWLEVLQWYADVADLSFDYTELPGGFLNLTTTRKYTLDETRDLLNQHLLSRGYTLIVRGEMMRAVKIDQLDPSLVPQVDPDELENYSPHEFVRTRFELPATMEPEQAKEDVKILLSPNAKVVPLLGSKQLLVIDAVVNLRDVRDLMYGERMAIAADLRPEEFPIRYQRAEWIADQVLIVLGMDPASRKSPQELQLEQMRMQMLMQMQQRQNKDVSKMMKEEGPPVYIAVDKRRNVLLVNAPPEQLAIIKRTIEHLDVPDGGTPAADDGRMEMRKYRTTTVSPDVVVTALKEIGRLAPLTQLQTDKNSKTIFAFATATDHETIEAMIGKLDGSGRGLHVIPLSRRSPADQVAGTLQALMVGEKEKEEDDGRRRRYYYPWDYGNDDEEVDTGEFRIQADLEHNRLLMWATDDEYDEAMGFLTQLGYVTLPGSGGNRVRVIEGTGDPEQTARLLERLQRSWSGENPLIINGAEQPSEEEAAPPATESEQPESDPQKDRLTLRRSRDVRIAGVTVATQWTQTEREPADAGEETGADDGSTDVSTPPAPINVTVTPDGRLVITSEDPAALDQLEDLMYELAAPPDDFAIFELQNSRASWVTINLEEYFAEELKGQRETVYDYWGDYAGTKDKDSGPMTLGRRRPLRFIWDNDTNTIVVQGASNAQLKVIEKLIKIYDAPVSEDAVAQRRTEAIPIKYSRAADIATALKEVYRDLLSSKDKEFQGGKDGQSRTRTETYYRFFGAGGGDDDSSKKSAAVKMAFEGALSIGVDEISNTLIISAEDNVFASIRQIVEKLDERAMPQTTVGVYEVRAAVSTSALQAALNEAMSQPWPGGKPPGQGGQKQGGEKGGDNNGNGENQRGNRQRNRD